MCCCRTTRGNDWPESLEPIAAYNGSQKHHHPEEHVLNPAATDALSGSESTATRKIQLLNVSIDDLTMEELLARFDHGILCTIHSDMLMWFQKDPEFYEMS